MDRGHREWQAGTPDELATLTCNAERRTEKRLGGCRPEADDKLWLDHLDFRVQPRAAGGDLGGIRLLMQPAFTLRLPLEVFDGIGDIDPGSVDAGLQQRFVEEPACWTDERFAFDILAVARLLPDHDHPGGLLTLAKNSLGGIFPQIARPATSRSTL